MIKVFCVEDDINIRELIEYTLTSSGFNIETFENAAAFSKRMKESVPDIVLLDIMLPDKDGMEILKELRTDSDTASLPVILLTAKSGRLDKIKGLDGGADDYITKPFDILELVSRINAVMRRSGVVRTSEQSELVYNGLIINTKSRKVTANSKDIILTYKEFELLYYLMSNKGIVLSRDKIMNEVWGIEFEGETRTVDVHIRTLRHKLGEYGRFIETVRNVGYKVE